MPFINTLIRAAGINCSHLQMRTYRARFIILVLFFLSLSLSLNYVRLYMRNTPEDLWISPPLLDPIHEVKDSGESISETLVVATWNADNSKWLKHRLPHIPTAIYIADDPESNITIPNKKGNEAMVYLSYIIDNYDKLPDVSIFIHGHSASWHVDSPLLHGMTDIILRLSRRHVLREGYVNLRCEWDPGCPAGKDLVEKAEKPLSREELSLRQMWAELRPQENLPSSISQTCCAQFAASRDSIRSVPLVEWQRYRSWLEETRMEDYYSGRAFEYSWAYILTGSAHVCPPMNICYCNGFGFCFGSAAKFQAWWDLRQESYRLRDEYISFKTNVGGENLSLKQRLEKKENLVRVQAALALERGQDLRNRLAETV